MWNSHHGPTRRHVVLGRIDLVDCGGATAAATDAVWRKRCRFKRLHSSDLSSIGPLLAVLFNRDLSIVVYRKRFGINPKRLDYIPQFRNRT